VAFVIRFGTGLLPEARTVIQDGDEVYVAAVSGHVGEAIGIAALPPGDDFDDESGR
jgi:trk system potassium uptake protein TrkA